MKATKILFIAIISLAFFLRVYNINQIPPGLSWDEVSIGYNAYSILKTGRDEHGKLLPLDTFAAYGDYKPPVAIYITVPFVALFGLNEWSVRLPSAIFGTLTVALLYFLVPELFAEIQTDKKKQKPDVKWFSTLSHVKAVAMTSVFLLALSPWHINISRAGFEANIALFFVLLGIYIVLRAGRTGKLWEYAWIPFVLSIYTFNSARYFVPIFSFYMLIVLRRKIQKNIGPFLKGIILATLLMLPIIPHLMSKEARLRFDEVNIFNDPAIIATANERISADGNTLLAKIIHNRRVGFARSYVQHFLDTFDPGFLFIHGDKNPKFSSQDTGQLYLIEAPFLVIGVLAGLNFFPKFAVFLVIWVITSIIPAATARETPHALRLLNSVPVWYIFIAWGLWYSMQKLFFQHANTRNIRVSGPYLGILIAVMSVCLYIFEAVYYLYNYYTHYPRIYAAEWQYGYKQAIDYLQNNSEPNSLVYVTDKIGRPYMYFLFYLKYDPATFQREKQAYFDAAGFYHVDGFDKYRFISASHDDRTSDSIVVGDPAWQEVKSKVLKNIYLPNGREALTIYR